MCLAGEREREREREGGRKGGGGRRVEKMNLPRVEEFFKEELLVLILRKSDDKRVIAIRDSMCLPNR